MDNRQENYPMKVGKKVVKAQRDILEAHSDYFKAMFRHGTGGRNKQVKLEDRYFEAVQIIVKLWNKTDMELTNENIGSPLSVASIFRAETALDVCLGFAEAELSTNNCLGIARACETHSLPVREKAFIYCLDNFDAIIQTTRLSSLKLKMFKKLIADDRLKVVSVNETDVAN